MYYVYILKSSKNNRYYIGSTRDFNKRLQEHNAGRTKGNKSYGPFYPVYREEYESLSEARKREYYIKSQKSRKYIERLINGA